MARDVRGCAILLKEMSGFDPKDSTSLDLPVPDYEAALTGNLKGVRVGIPKEYRVDRSEEHTSEIQSLMRISYAVICLKKQTKQTMKQNESNKYASIMQYI